MTLKISIVTISFNQSQYLRRCIDSVLQQKYANLQYIVVDPGSTDGSREIIKEYSNFLDVVFDKDLGPADGLNNGFAIADGEIFYFLNADDYLEEGSLEYVNNFFSKNSEFDILVGNGFIDRGITKKPVDSECLRREYLIFRSCRIFQAGTFFKRSLFIKSGGFNINNLTCWDYELFIRFTEFNPACFHTTKRLASFRIHKNSITGSGRLEREYLDDLARIYLESTGKPWCLTANLYSLCLRASSFLKRTLLSR